MSIVAVGYFFLVGWFLGLTVIKGLKIKLDLVIKLIGGWLVGVILLTQIIFWQSFLIPFSGQSIILSLILITLICNWWWHKHKWLEEFETEIRKKIKKRELIRWILLLGFWGSVFLIIWGRMLVLEPKGLYAGWVNIWGDWAAHLSYTTSFAYGDNFPVQMPLLVGHKFAYPFLADFLSAILVKLGASLIGAMLIPSWLLSMMLVVVLVEFGKTLTRNLKTGILTGWLFLLNGGIGFWWWLKDLKKLGVAKTLSNLPREYTHLEKLANIEWINIISSQVVPQRGFLLGFPLVILIYILLWKHWQRRQKRALLLAGWLTAMLPLIHAHSFGIVGFVAGTLAVIQIIKAKNKKERRGLIKMWMRFFLPVILVGAGQSWYFYGQSLSQEGFIRFKPGWLAYRDGKWWWVFWLKNLGVMVGLVLMGIKLAKDKLKWFSLPFWGLFLMANLWIWQPWEWDNTKFFTHWYLLASVLAAGVIERGLNQKNRWGRVLTMMLLILAVWAGSLDVWRLTQYEQRKIKFWDNKELNLSTWVRNNTEAEAIFLTANNHDHWLPTLTGRKIVFGFPGWLWTYGIDYGEQERAVRKMFKGGLETESLLRFYGVDYIVVGPLERAQKINEKYFEINFQLAYQLGETRIYRVD